MIIRDKSEERKMWTLVTVNYKEQQSRKEVLKGNYNSWQNKEQYRKNVKLAKNISGRIWGLILVAIINTFTEYPNLSSISWHCNTSNFLNSMTYFHEIYAPQD